jgi:hypothetical protein
MMNAAQRRICRRCTAERGQGTETFAYHWDRLSMVWCRIRDNSDAGAWQDIRMPLDDRCKYYLEQTVVGQEQP